MDPDWSLILQFVQMSNLTVPWTEDEFYILLNTNQKVNTASLSQYKFYRELIVPLYAVMDITSKPIGRVLEGLYPNQVDILFILGHAILKTHGKELIRFESRELIVDYDNFLHQRMADIMRPCFPISICVVQGNTIASLIATNSVIEDWSLLNRDILRVIRHVYNINIDYNLDRSITKMIMRLMRKSKHIAITFAAHIIYAMSERYVIYRKRED